MSAAGVGIALGAVPHDGATTFRVWAPRARRVRLRLPGPPDRVLELRPEPRGYWALDVEDAPPGTRYFYRLDDGPDRPDPASRWQPQGLHGPSAVVGPTFEWTDAAWTGIRLDDCVFYELHVGTFTADGTFDAVVPQLDRLRDLGITCIESMPVGQFPGTRNWGYDGALPFAAQDSYGGPAGLRRLVDACHARGLGLCLDVVYNHFGPEGNHVAEFGPYLSDRYHTPWGDAINFDGPGSDEVRRFFLENALYWIVECHVDALRLDAVHAIVDTTATPFLQELALAVHRVADGLGRRVQLIAESALNDPRLVRPPKLGGYGLDAQWDDDFHHALHVLLTGEHAGYYSDYGGVTDLGRAFRGGYVYTGQHSRFRGRRHGADAGDVPACRFVVFAQNHDQVGNRRGGERLAQLVDPEALKLAAATVGLSPFLPLLFMGEEYGETAPFRYFVSHTEPELIAAVRAGRRTEMARFAGEGEPTDPQGLEVFEAARPRRTGAGPADGALFAFHRELFRLRRTHPALGTPGRTDLDVVAIEETRTLYVRRWCHDDEVALVLHFGEHGAVVPVPLPPGDWRVLLDSAAARWGGPGVEGPDAAGATGATLRSEGQIALVRPPRSALLLHCERNS